MKRYPSYKDSGIERIGELPSSWQEVKCGFLFRVLSVKNNVGETNLSVYRDYGVIPRDSRDDNHNRLSEDTSDYKLVRIGNFVFNKMKCWMGSLGVSNYRGIVSPAYTVCETTQPCHGEFLHYLLRSSEYIQEYAKLSYGVRVGQWELRFHDFRDIVAVLPPLPEQQQIARYLEYKTKQIDTLIEKTEQKIALLKEQRKALINHVVTKGLDPDAEMKDSGVEWIGEIPAHWKISKLKYELNFHNNMRVPLSAEERGTRPGEYRYYGSTSVIDYIDDYNYDGEFILVAEDGANLLIRNLRLSFMVDGKFWVNNHAHVMSAVSHWPNIYYCELLELTDFTTFVSGSAQPKLTYESITNLPIVVPPDNEIECIGKDIIRRQNQIGSIISKETERGKLLNDYRQSLISEVVTGKIDVRDEVVP